MLTRAALTAFFAAALLSLTSVARGEMAPAELHTAPVVPAATIDVEQAIEHALDHAEHAEQAAECDVTAPSHDRSPLGPWRHEYRTRHMRNGQGSLPLFRVGARTLDGCASDERWASRHINGALQHTSRYGLSNGIGIPMDSRHRVEIGHPNR